MTAKTTSIDVDTSCRYTSRSQARHRCHIRQLDELTPGYRTGEGPDPGGPDSTTGPVRRYGAGPSAVRRRRDVRRHDEGLHHLGRRQPGSRSGRDAPRAYGTWGRADIVVGASVGALSAAYYAARPDADGVEELAPLWLSVGSHDVYPLDRSQALRTLRTNLPLHPVRGFFQPIGLMNYTFPFNPALSSSTPCSAAVTTCSTTRRRDAFCNGYCPSSGCRTGRTRCRY
jgi:hypothetical protein